jgi:molecular chaperone GrpE
MGKKKDEPIVEEMVAEEVEVLEAPPEKADALTEMTDRYARTLAEFDNYRKRTAKEMAARYDDGIRSACEKLLPIVDNFERALPGAPENEPFADGIRMIARQFADTLAALGIEQVAAETGTPFDPNVHNAVGTAEAENAEPNTIVATLQPGYAHRGKLIRPAMVTVAG